MRIAVATVVCGLAVTGLVLAQGVTDAQIASIVVTANQVDIDAGKLAAEMTKNPEVKKFAELMVTDHTGVNKQAVALVTKLKVKPEDNETSKSLGCRRREEHRQPEDAHGGRVRQGVHRPGGRLPHGGDRGRGQDAHPQRAERRVEGADRQGAAGVCRTSRAREAGAVLARQVKLSMIRRALTAFVVLCACCAVSAAAQQARKPVTHTVTIDGSSFKPSALTIKAGDTVMWVNKDIVSHTATSTAPKGFESGALETGKSWKHTFKAKGDFPYVCRFHPIMKATLRIQ